MKEMIFLIILALCWIVFAVVQDLKKREVADWLNFSLIIFALGFRFFYDLFHLEYFAVSLMSFEKLILFFHPLNWIFAVKEFFIFVHTLLGNFPFFQQGVYGLMIFFAIGNALYYSRFFAGGDAKLMIALGTVLPFSDIFETNVKTFLVFFFIFLFAGAFYGLTVSSVISLKNFKKFRKEFFSQFAKRRKFFYIFLSAGILFVAFGFFEEIFFVLGFLSFVSLFFNFYAKAIDESVLIKKTNVNELAEGDWLYHEIKAGKEIIPARWEGLSKAEINTIKQYHESVLIKQGIPLTPVFLVSFLVLILFKDFLLRNPFW